MDNAMIVALCLLLPFLGTVVGSASSLMLRSDPGDRIRKGLLGFAGGVMIAASVWSLLVSPERASVISLRTPDSKFICIFKVSTRF